MFDKTKVFLKNHNLNETWEPLNLISRNASAVGCYDLDIIDPSQKTNCIDKLKNNEFKIVFMFGQDKIKFKKINEFVIYIGTHGDQGAELADIILPSAAYTEQDGYYTNLEGKLQKAFKANYPPGEAKEDWIIINDLANKIKNKTLYKNKDYLIDSLINFLKINKKNTLNNLDQKFLEEKIDLDYIDYYHSNVIARASKTMNECKNSRINLKMTGTDG